MVWVVLEVCPDLRRQFSPWSVIIDGIFLSTRLPDLSIVITLDSKLPGTFHMDEVMQAGDSSHMKQLRATQQSLSCNEPINIQFTSVGASARSMPCGCVHRWAHGELNISFPLSSAL